MRDAQVGTGRDHALQQRRGDLGFRGDGQPGEHTRGFIHTLRHVTGVHAADERVRTEQTLLAGGCHRVGEQRFHITMHRAFQICAVDLIQLHEHNLKTFDQVNRMVMWQGSLTVTVFGCNGGLVTGCVVDVCICCSTDTREAEKHDCRCKYQVTHGFLLALD